MRGDVSGGSGTDSFATIARPGNHNQLSGVIALSASRTKSNVSILANPTLVTTHNKEARLFVGESRPTFGQIQTVDNTTSTSSTSASALRSSISQTEAGIELTIKPLIGSDGTVQLEVDLERVVDLGHLAGREFDVDDRADHPGDAADAGGPGAGALGGSGGHFLLTLGSLAAAGGAARAAQGCMA